MRLVPYIIFAIPQTPRACAVFLFYFPHYYWHLASRVCHFAAMSDYSGSPSDHQLDIQPPKRKVTQAGLDGNSTGRSVKRRASKACQCCRARKVRCNVTEHGAPCTNCRLDEVECIVSESRRKKLVYPPSATSDSPSTPARLPLNQRIELASPSECRHTKLVLGHLGLAICSAFILSRSATPKSANDSRFT